MPYPVTILPTPQGYYFSDSGAPAGQYGFEHNGNQYAFLYQGGFHTPAGDQKLHAMKSTDLGLTWAEQDAANAITPTAPAGLGVCYTVAVDGNTVLVMAIHAHTPVSTPIIDGIDFWTYSLVSDTWTAGPTLYATPLPDFMGKDSVSQSHQVVLQLVVRAAGDYVLMYSGPQAVSGATGHNLARVYFATFNGTTFSTGTILPGQSGNLYFFGSKATADASLRTWFFGMDNASNAFLGPNLLYWVMDHSGTINNGTVAPGIFWANTSGTISKPQVFLVSSVETIAIVSEFNDNVSNTSQSLRFYSAATSMTPTWASVNITQGVDGSNAGNPAFSNTTLFPVPQFYFMQDGSLDLVYSNGKLQATWIVTLLTGGLFIGHFYSSTSTNNGTTWSAQSLLFDSVDLLPGVEDDEAYQVYAYPMASGIGTLGVTSESTFQGLAAQFFFTLVAGAPTCSIGASPSTIVAGQVVTLTWTTANSPTTATISGIGSVNPAGGTTTVSPLVTTTYVLTVSNSFGTSTCQTTVTVGAPTPVAPVGGVCAPHIDCVIELYKNPIDSDLYTFDWSGFLGTDVIIASNWAAFPPGATIVSSSFTATTTNVTLGGGLAGNVYLLRNGIATKGGRALVRSARLFVSISTAVPAAPIQ